MNSESDTSLWGSLDVNLRSLIKEHANRVYEMSQISRTGGTEPEQHADTGTSTFNNPRSIDWAVWKLLIALRDAGYDEPPI